ncbi:hypothetical protein Smp_174100 [Schistosoma mansoni]|uniref:hypothetical protein n=1 Tax=Schistosoma mansoni TaxID=6183 RepID=UPI0001A61CF1|nr:hypothetical protein Smp_174100 [Schistosoma mansoni]|eukprot:XP_018654686.1 hypothetical protein Smp_174100 [Schistosoma mansoni]
MPQTSLRQKICEIIEKHLSLQPVSDKVQRTQAHEKKQKYRLSSFYFKIRKFRIKISLLGIEHMFID